MEYPESRPVEALPPSTLDNYLVHFFSSVKKKNGSDYNANGLKEIRKYLQHYLKSKGYPESLTKSERFMNSQMVFKKQFALRKERST